MDKIVKKQTEKLVDRAVSGDKKALEELLLEVQDMVFNLSLRMLGTINDAEDASQEIIIKVMTHLSAFRKESEFSTWVFKIAVNYLKDYQRNMFSQHPLSFEFYGADIANGKTEDLPDLTQGAEQSVLEEELKFSCTNVMLQCLDKESRCIFILGVMFKVDSRIAGEILEITPEAYRKRLSRVRREMADFMAEYCGLSGGMCNCRKRINYAISSHRLNPENLEYAKLLKVKEAMEQVDDLSFTFASLPFYRASEEVKKWVCDFLESKEWKIIKEL